MLWRAVVWALRWRQQKQAASYGPASVFNKTKHLWRESARPFCEIHKRAARLPLMKWRMINMELNSTQSWLAASVAEVDV